jgi:hypothetical protein
MNIQAAKKWVWVGAAAAAVVLSLLIWGGFALLSLSDEAVNASAGVLADFPQVHSWLAWGANMAEGVGSVVLWIVWSVGIVGVLALALFGMWLTRHAKGNEYARQIAVRVRRDW